MRHQETSGTSGDTVYFAQSGTVLPDQVPRYLLLVLK